MSPIPPAAAPSDSSGTCLIYQLCDLIDATAKMDAKPRNRYQAEQGLIAVAHRVAAAAGPVLDGENALIVALREAAASRPPIPKTCLNCQKVDDGRCGRHAGGLTVAETFNELGQALSGPSYTEL